MTRVRAGGPGRPPVARADHLQHVVRARHQHRRAHDAARHRSRPPASDSNSCSSMPAGIRATGATSVFDFTDGLGSWGGDRDRFPSGLASLADYAHERGLKFGIWVEPERVALEHRRSAGAGRGVVSRAAGRRLSTRYAERRGARRADLPGRSARRAHGCWRG